MPTRKPSHSPNAAALRALGDLLDVRALSEITPGRLQTWQQAVRILADGDAPPTPADAD